MFDMSTPTVCTNQTFVSKMSFVHHLLGCQVIVAKQQCSRMLFQLCIDTPLKLAYSVINLFPIVHDYRLDTNIIHIIFKYTCT